MAVLEPLPQAWQPMRAVFLIATKRCSTEANAPGVVFATGRSAARHPPPLETPLEPSSVSALSSPSASAANGTTMGAHGAAPLNSTTVDVELGNVPVRQLRQGRAVGEHEHVAARVATLPSNVVPKSLKFSITGGGRHVLSSPALDFRTESHTTDSFTWMSRFFESTKW